MTAGDSTRDAHHLDPAVRDEPAARTSARPVSFLVQAALFTAGFVAVTRAVAPPHTEDDILRAKLAHWATHADDYDAVFLGSSRVYRAFDPFVFERRTGEIGEPVRAFNFGLLYARPHELDTLLEFVLAHRGEGLNYVFVEVMDWAPSLDPNLADQERTILWHTPRQTASAIETTWRSEAPLVGKLWLTGRHVGHSVKRTVNFGGGTVWLRSLVEEEWRHRQWSRVIAQGRGYVRYDQETDPRYPRERRAFLETYVDDYLRQVARIDEENVRRGSLEHFNVAAQHAQQERIEAAGAEAVYVVPNVRFGTPDWHRLDDAGVVETLFTFNHVERYPELYALEHRFDRRHLNAEGATRFSELLAERFHAWRGE